MEDFLFRYAVLYALSTESGIVWKNVNAELLTAGHADSKKY